MEAKVQRVGEVLLIHLKGQLNFESADAFRLTCRKHIRNEKVIVDLRELDFVGSSGITPLLETIAEIHRADHCQLKLCGVGSEFIRIFQASDIAQLEIYENEANAQLAYEHPGYFSQQAAPVQQPELVPVNFANPVGPVVPRQQPANPVQGAAPAAPVTQEQTAQAVDLELPEHGFVSEKNHSS